ncbi:Stf0 family sulfotransferase [Mesorhizobium sp. 10J20-29]
MKTLLILSEMRNGSSWLGSLTNSTRLLGNAGEWLRPGAIDEDQISDAKNKHRSILKRASTDNGVFAVKIFPYHLYRHREKYGYDFIERCIAEHSVFVVLLERIDRLGAAISAARAFSTGRWSHPIGAEFNVYGGEDKSIYDREAILENISYIGKSMAFWRNYLTVRCIPYMPVYYEHIIHDPRDYVCRVASEMQVIVDPQVVTTNLQVQRDDISRQWRERFQSEAKSPAFKHTPEISGRYARNMRNLTNFIVGRKLVSKCQPPEFMEG